MATAYDSVSFTQDELQEVILRIVDELDLDPDEDAEQIARIIGVQVHKRTFNAEIVLNVRIVAWDKGKAEETLGEVEDALSRGFEAYNEHTESHAEISGWTSHICDG